MLAREHEHTLNVWLAAALQKYGLTARAESVRAAVYLHMNRYVDAT